MKKLAIAGLCAGLAAAPLAVRAAELLLVDASGRPVAILVPVVQPGLVAAQPGGFPLASLFAQQQAMLSRMMVDMQALPAMGAPAAAPGFAVPGSAMMVSSFAGGGHFCSRTITYQTRPGAAPLVNVSQTGDGCTALPGAAPQAATPAAEPAPETVAPRPVLPGHTRLYQIDYRHPATTPKLPRG